MADIAKWRKVRFYEIVKRDGLEVRRYLPFYHVQKVDFSGQLWEPVSALGTTDFTGAKGYIPEVHGERPWDAATANMMTCQSRPDGRALTLHDYNDCKFPYA